MKKSVRVIISGLIIGTIVWIVAVISVPSAVVAFWAILFLGLLMAYILGGNGAPAHPPSQWIPRDGEGPRYEGEDD